MTRWLCFLLATSGFAGTVSEFDGTWVMRFRGEPVLILTIHSTAGGLEGRLTRPVALAINQDGEVTNLGPEQVTLEMKECRASAGRLEFQVRDDPFVMTIAGKDRATLALEGMRPWVVERTAPGEPAVLATRLPSPDYPPEILQLRKRLHAMVEQDQAPRMSFDTARMEAVDAANRDEILTIYRKYGWVTKSLAGGDAAHDYWLLVQHQTPEIQRELLPALEKAAKADDASLADYAYLYDRVQMGLGKPQRWGTGVRCENGTPVLAPVEDEAGLAKRRAELYLMPIAEYLKSDYLTQFCASTVQPAAK